MSAEQGCPVLPFGEKKALELLHNPLEKDGIRHHLREPPALGSDVHVALLLLKYDC